MLVEGASVSAADKEGTFIVPCEFRAAIGADPGQGGYPVLCPEQDPWFASVLDNQALVVRDLPDMGYGKQGAGKDRGCVSRLEVLGCRINDRTYGNEDQDPQEVVGPSIGGTGRRGQVSSPRTACQIVCQKSFTGSL